MSKSLGPSPGAVRHPQHEIQIAASTDLWTAELNGNRLAASRATLSLNETGYPQQIYFPRQDVRTELLAESDSRTTCPFKGQALYLAAEIDGKTEDVAWFYPDVYDEVAEIADYIAFYADRVTLRSDNKSN